MTTQIELDFNPERLRYSLVGDGYTLEEVEKLTQSDLINILRERVTQHIDREFYKGKRMGLHDSEE